MSMQRMFNVRCDGVDEQGRDCYEVYDGSEWYASDARRVAKQDGWVRKNRKDYCPSCAERQVWKVIDNLSP